MRVISILTGIVMATMMLSCSDDAPSRVEIEKSSATYEADDIELTINGNPMTDESLYAIIRLPELEEGEEVDAYDGKILFTTNGLLIPDKCNITDVKQIYRMEFDAIGLKNKICFEGSYNMYEFWLKVRGEVTFTDKGKKKLKIDAVYSSDYEDTLLGRTFEIDFNDESIFPGVYGWNDTKKVKGIDGEEITGREAVKWVFREMNKAYVENSGFAGARFTFNPDYTLSVNFRDATTGEYIPSDAPHRFFFVGRYIYFLDEYPFVKSNADCYNLMGKCKAKWTSFYQWENWASGSCLSDPCVLITHYRLDDEGKLWLEWVSPGGDYSFCYVMWGERGEITYPTGVGFVPANEVESIVNFVIWAYSKGGLDYDAIAIARSVD